MNREGAQNTKNRAMLSVGRGVLKLVYDGFKMQLAQVGLFAGEVRDKVERMQQYGLTSNPHPGAEVTVVSVGGNRDHTVIIACDDRRYRVKGLQTGEVALYTDEGDTITLKRGKVVEINTNTLNINAATAVNITSPTVSVNSTTAINLTTPTVQASAALKAAGQITDLSGSNTKTVQNMRQVFNNHTHNENNNLGGPTNTPNQTI